MLHKIIFSISISISRELNRQLASFWAEINHAHAFHEGNTHSQTAFFEQLARHAGWTLDVSRLSPHHPLSVHSEFVAALFEYQRIRDASGGLVVPGNTGFTDSTDAPSTQEAARDLDTVLYGLVKPDNSLCGPPAARRGRSRSWDGSGLEAEAKAETKAGIEAVHSAEPEARPAQFSVIKARYARHPELRGMKLDPYELSGENEHAEVRRADDDYQP